MKQKFVTRFRVVRDIDQWNDEYLVNERLDQWSRDDAEAESFDDEAEALALAEKFGGWIEDFKCLGYFDAIWASMIDNQPALEAAE